MSSRLKLAANHWMIAMVAALAETMHLCELMGLGHQQFVTLLDGGPLGSSYGLQKRGRDAPPRVPGGFPVRLALKDLKLVEEVATGSGVELPVLDAVLERIGGVEGIHGDDDVAAVYELKLPSVGAG
jgi:3-hydroxyisobutyrate dehydrogenase